MTGRDIYETLAVYRDRLAGLGWAEETSRLSGVLDLLEERLGMIVAVPAVPIDWKIKMERGMGHRRVMVQFELEHALHGSKLWWWSLREQYIFESPEAKLLLSAAGMADAKVIDYDELVERKPRVMVLLRRIPSDDLAEYWQLMIKGAASTSQGPYR